jgi:hypothetical protein
MTVEDVANPVDPLVDEERLVDVVVEITKRGQMNSEEGRVKIMGMFMDTKDEKRPDIHPIELAMRRSITALDKSLTWMQISLPPYHRISGRNWNQLIAWK